MSEKYFTGPRAFRVRLVEGRSVPGAEEISPEFSPLVTAGLSAIHHGANKLSQNRILRLGVSMPNSLFDDQRNLHPDIFEVMRGQAVIPLFDNEELSLHLLMMRGVFLINAARAATVMQQIGRESVSAPKGLRRRIGFSTDIPQHEEASGILSAGGTPRNISVHYDQERVRTGFRPVEALSFAAQLTDGDSYYANANITRHSRTNDVAVSATTGHIIVNKDGPYVNDSDLNGPSPFNALNRFSRVILLMRENPNLWVSPRA